MTGWGIDSERNAEWRDYAAQLRGELPEPPPTLRFRAWRASMQLSRALPVAKRAAIANFVATVGRDLKVVRRPDGRIVIPQSVESFLDGAMALGIAVAIVYAVFVVAPQFVALLRRDGVIQ